MHLSLFEFDFAQILFQFDEIFYCWLNVKTAEFFYQPV